VSGTLRYSACKCVNTPYSQEIKEVTNVQIITAFKKDAQEVG
jgi:hypothetical protein